MQDYAYCYTSVAPIVDGSRLLTQCRAVVAILPPAPPFAPTPGRSQRLDISIGARTEFAALKVAPHGLIGQTFDGDGVAVDGAVDDYSGAVVVTKV